MTTQSSKLSANLTAMVEGGRRLNDNSKGSEKTLEKAMLEVMAYSQTKYPEHKIERKKQISLFECQETLAQMGGPTPDPANKTFYMKPDGGYMFAKHGDRVFPLLIVEDKTQGSNDKRLAEKKTKQQTGNVIERAFKKAEKKIEQARENAIERAFKKAEKKIEQARGNAIERAFKKAEKKIEQATGNAIERAFKNIRGSEMLFAPFDIFPYVIFASGCDFHHTKTISKRVEMGNYGCPNHYIEVNSATTPESLDAALSEIINKIDVRKRWGGRSIALFFMKAHKWDELPNGSSAWTTEERVRVLKVIIDQVFEYYATVS